MDPISDQSIRISDLDNNINNFNLFFFSYYQSEPHQTSLRHAQGPDSQDSRNYFMNGHVTPLEIGMYILLAVFCAAMAVFMASCFVYASKIKRQEYPLHTSFSILSTSGGGNHGKPDLGRKTPVQDAHDWIWLGKSTLGTLFYVSVYLLPIRTMLESKSGTS